MKNKQTILTSFVILVMLLACISCRTSSSSTNTTMWRMFFCVPESMGGQKDTYLLLKTGVEVSDQGAIASYLSVLDRSSGYEKKRHFCGFETDQVFESNGVPVFVTSISGCGLVKCSKWFKVEKFSYGYQLREMESVDKYCPQYSSACHHVFEDAVRDMSDNVVQTYVRNRRSSIINRFGCRLQGKKE